MILIAFPLAFKRFAWFAMCSPWHFRSFALAFLDVCIMFAFYSVIIPRSYASLLFLLYSALRLCPTGVSEYHLSWLVLMTTVRGDVFYAGVVCTRLSADGLFSVR